ncbi:hypothetical protein [Sphingobium yanoikuyae]|nr:hypothetical protein [Sphingobium yanoikuyae]
MVKIARFDAIFVGTGILICVALAVVGVWAMSRGLHAPINDPPARKRVHFTIQPGQTQRVAAYVAGEGTVRFVSDSRGAKVRYRLRLEDGHQGSILADTIASGIQRGELRPQHGSLYEWSWSNLSPNPAHIGFFAEGNFDILNRTGARQPDSLVAP